jgi:SAM-dependent methyltransferase
MTARGAKGISDVRKSGGLLKKSVAERYTKAASEAREAPIYGSCCQPTSVPSVEEAVAKVSALGYSAEDVKRAPIEAVALSMGCGNPTKYAHVCPGETVLDIGCGAGLDSILSAKAVGRSGTVLATDLTRSMLRVCRQNSRGMNLSNLEFIACDGENLPFADESVHHIIANCSVNLMPNKQRVLEEAHRVVREDGCVTFSDILSTAPLPERFKKDMELWAACIGGVVTEDSFLQGFGAAGFKSVKVLDRRVFHYGEKDKRRIRKYFGDRSDISSSVLDLDSRVETLIVQAQGR